VSLHCQRGAELTAAGPLRKSVREAVAKCVRQYPSVRRGGSTAYSSQSVVVEIALLAGVQCERRGALQQDLYNKARKSRFSFGREREGIDSKIAGFKAYPYIGAMEELSEAFKASAQVKKIRV